MRILMSVALCSSGGRRLAQERQAPRQCLSFRIKPLATSPCVGWLRAARITERKSCRTSHEFSKRKHEPRGILVQAVRSKGTWSEQKRVREERVVLGKIASHSTLTKHLSSLTRVGSARLLLQVYARSASGISMRQREFIRSLKLFASAKLKLSLFLSAGLRVRLKSPITIHAPQMVAATDASSVKKPCFSSRRTGAYTFVRVNSEASEASLNFVVSDY